MAELPNVGKLSIQEIGSGAPAPKGQGPPILPVEGKRNVLISSALPYVNNVPHLGNIIGCVLSADVFARYSRLRGYNTLFVCGTDEYGTATETKAFEEGVTPKEICDKYNALHTQVYSWFNISFDHFGRTSCEHQTRISQDIFLKLHQRGFLKEDTMEQLYCEKCEKFLADRFVEGECPICGFPDARGDQCDGCQKLLDPTELIKPRCKQCKGTQIVVKSTTHQFLDLPKLQEDLKSFAESSKANGKWTNNSFTVTDAWVKNLLPRCITRDLKWGVPVPLEGEQYKNKVLYVWFDAPIGYISITADYTDEWEKWWKNPKNVDLIQFMGKDNIPFHTVLFPASLIGSGDPYTLLHSISTTEYLTYEGKKFSKGRKTGVFGDEMQTLGLPADVWRFYLLAIRPETSDADFNWDDFAAKNNNELLANLGNFFNRALKFLQSNFGGVVQKIELTERDKQLIEKVNPLIAEYHAAFADFHIKEALRVVLAIGKLGNQYFQDEVPWVKVNTDRARAGSAVSLGCNLTKLIATLLEPYLPVVAQTVFKQLNTTHELLPDTFELTLPENHKIGNPEPIFKKIEDKDIKAFRAKFQGTQDNRGETSAGENSFPAVFKVGKVVEVESHPTADTLYVLKVEVGEKQPRQVVAGLKLHYTPEELKDKEVVVLINLKPSKLRGVASEAMLVVAEKKEGDKVILGLLKVNGEAAIGTPILPQGYSVPAKPKALDYKKDFLKLPLVTDENSQVFFVNASKVSIPVLAEDKTIIPDKTIAGGNLK